MRGVSRSSRYAGRDAVAAAVFEGRDAREFPGLPGDLARHGDDDHTVCGRPKACHPGASASRQGAGRRRRSSYRGRWTSPSVHTTVVYSAPATGGASRSKPFQPLRAERRMISACSWRLRSCAFHFCTRGCGCARASGVPRALIQGEAMKELRAPPRRHNNRGDGAWLLSARVVFGANGASPARGLFESVDLKCNGSSS